jgi:hypothetical protein
MIFYKIFESLKDFLFIDIFKNFESDEGLVMIINNNINTKHDRTEILLGLVNFISNKNFNKYKFVYIITLFPKNYIMKISPTNLLDDFINKILNIRFCKKVPLYGLQMDIQIPSDVSGDTKIYYFDKNPPGHMQINLCSPINTIFANYIHEYLLFDISEEKLVENAYKNALKGIHSNNVYINEPFLNFSDGKKTMHYLGHDHEFVVGHITNHAKMYSRVPNLEFTKTNNIENQKQLFSYLLTIYLKYRTNLNYIIPILKTGIGELELLLKTYPSYNVFIDEFNKCVFKQDCLNAVHSELFQKYYEKNKYIKPVKGVNRKEIELDNEMCSQVEIIVENINEKSLEFYKCVSTLIDWGDAITNNDCIGILISINTNKIPKNGTYIDGIVVNEVTTCFMLSSEYIKKLHEQEFDGNITNLHILGESNINMLLPIYINNQHWLKCQRYIPTIFGMAIARNAALYSENMLKIYYNILMNYSYGMFFTQDAISWNKNWVQCWVSLFRTCYQISFDKKYYKGFQKYIDNLKQYDNYITLCGQMISINYKNPAIIYNIMESVIMKKIIKYIDTKSIGVLELFEENDQSIYLEIQNIVEEQQYIKYIFETLITTLFIISMIKDVWNGFDDIIKELNIKDSMLNENMTDNIFEYCCTFKNLSNEEKVQILINKKKLPIINIFDNKHLTKKLKYHYDINPPTKKSLEQNSLKNQTVNNIDNDYDYSNNSF